MNNLKELEKIFKGCANYRRLRALFFLQGHPDASLSDIAEELGGDFKAIAEHVRKLFIAGLVNKKKIANEVQHTLTTRGKAILQFCRIVL